VEQLTKNKQIHEYIQNTGGIRAAILSADGSHTIGDRHAGMMAVIWN